MTTPINLNTPIEQIPRTTKLLVPKLKKLKIETVRDLLWHHPVRHEDFSKIYKIAELQQGKEATVQGTIKNIKTRRSWQKRIFITEAVISDETGSIYAIWFNQPYITRQLKKDSLANFAGKITLKNNALTLSNPAYELVTDTKETTHTGRIIAKYPETRGLTSKGIRYFMTHALENIGKIKDPLPKNILENQNLPEINTALHNIHFPDTMKAATQAKRRFDFEDLFLLQLHNLEQRLKLANKKAPAIKIEVEEIKKEISPLPFELTASQKKSLWEIIQEIGKCHPMNRLLQGDVGSGKTIVVALAAILTAQKGQQTAFMAPTEILAHQHYKNLIKLFPKFEHGITLLTSSEAKIYYGEGLENSLKKAEAAKQITKGNASIVIGTHALIQKTVNFPNLALVIIDEQHRFGVRQRAELLNTNQESGIRNHKKSSTITASKAKQSPPIIHNSKFITPHLLSMSATPIPRTLNLTLFGDLDLSLITELPKNRKPITTKIVDPKDRKKAHEFIEDQIKKGRQAFVICPRIEPSEDKDPRTDPRKSALLDVKSVKEEHEKLSQKIFPNLRVAMLHGKMKSKEKEETMTLFSNGDIDILVSTSVVEVGVDVPNATIMMIDGAERFGLAQLYQFRGRVGRGEHESACLLFTEAHSTSVHTRLQSITEAKNGLELAERDLKLRGPGEFLGEVQTGMPDLAMKALKNPDLVKYARDAAKEILTTDRNLTNHPLLRKHLSQFQRAVHWE